MKQKIGSSEGENSIDELLANLPKKTYKIQINKMRDEKEYYNRYIEQEASDTVWKTYI